MYPVVVVPLLLFKRNSFIVFSGKQTVSSKFVEKEIPGV